jgi:DNA-binding response OmpR family regulator
VILAIVAESQELLTAIAGGANDVVIRPFRSCELLARLRASLSSDGGGVNDLQLDSQLNAVQLGGTEIRLRRAEFNVLQYIVAHGSRVVSAQEILEAVFGTSGDGGTIRNHVWEIRRKLRDAGLPIFIATVKGVGYRANLAAIDAWRSLVTASA